jgi:sulfide dehydrogenase cytochrome subunit
LQPLAQHEDFHYAQWSNRINIGPYPTGVTVMRRITEIAFLLLIALSGIAAAQDPDSIMAGCADCHGDNGVSQWNDVPTIAGIDAFVGSEALFIYRDQARPCASSEYRQGDTSRVPTDMCEVVSEFSDELIEGVAEYFSNQTFVAAKQAFDAELVVAGEEIHDRDCERCHSDGGSNADDEAGILAGQWTGYLQTAFDEYASGEREQLDKMQEAMAKLSADDVQALLAYYASQQ